jgi:hypothetical protein
VLNPDIEIPRRYKLKEHHMREALQQNFPNTQMTFDKRVSDGCSTFRPDVLIDNGFPIIIECDENRHRGASYSCENKRLMTLFQDLGNRPLRVIRFNPDCYTDASGIKYKSCFKATTKGLSVDKKEWARRIGVLTTTLNTLFGGVPEKELDVLYQFYE